MKYCCLLIILIVCSCKPSAKHIVKDSKTKDIGLVTIKTTAVVDTDSIKIADLLDKAINYTKHRSDNSYFKRVCYSSDSLIWVSYTYGHLFSNTQKHLIVKRSLRNYTVYNDIYVLKENNLVNVCTDIQSDMTFIKCMQKDVNGDGYKDFLVHWYPSSGCCMRNIFNVYIYQPKNGSFTLKYKFINPTFSPKEKIIRGVEYGQH